MDLRGAILFLLLGFATAGPVSQNRAQCSRECPGDSKFQYSSAKTYVYAYEASNTLHTQRSSELSSVLKATIEITPISKCDMVLQALLKERTVEPPYNEMDGSMEKIRYMENSLCGNDVFMNQIVDVTVKHGDSFETASAFIDDLKRHPLHFAFLDGEISDICPSESESEDIVNIKRGILSTLQNTMKTLSHDTLVRETDVLGSCDTEYKVKEHKGDKYIIYKVKRISSCTDHVTFRTGLISSSYESPGSPFQKIPLMTNEEYSCHNVIGKGIVQESFCSQKSDLQPLRNMGYNIHTTGEVKLQLLAEKDAQVKSISPHPRKSLVYKYQRKDRHFKESDAKAALAHLCEQADSLLKEDVGKTVNELIYLIRDLEPASVKSLYQSLKNKQLCDSAAALGIFIDVLKASASEGAIEVLTELVNNKELSKAETLLWIAGIPFVSDPDEGAIRASIPLLKPENKAAVLAVSSLAHKYCLNHPECESSPAIQAMISSLQSHIHDDCEVSSHEEEEKVTTVLKAFGNLGYVGSAKQAILKCAAQTKRTSLRIVALEAFRRSPCVDSVSSELLKIYENVNEEDEIRISALIMLSKCPAPAIIFRISKAYAIETNKQVAVFTYTYLQNLKETSDPMKLKGKMAASKLSLTAPDSVDVTKFSRNLELSSFSKFANLGYGLEANLIHSHHSFLPRSGSVDFKVDLFGKQINLLEVGLRVENLEHKLEEFLGPRGLIPLSILHDSHNHHASSSDSTADVFKARIKSLKEKVNMEHSDDAKASVYIRILGHELEYLSLDSHNLHELADINLHRIFDRLKQYRTINQGHSIMFKDGTIIFPSLTGRSFKLKTSGSATVALKTDGKMDILDSTLKNFQFILDKRYQPSATVELSAALSIHSEDYEPGVKVANTINVADDAKLKVELKKGSSLDAKLSIPGDKLRMLSVKRKFYEFDRAGERLMPEPESRNYEYCMKSLDKLFGLKYCGKLTFPKFRGFKNLENPLGQPVEFYVERAKADSSNTDIEFTFHLPESKDDQVQEYKLGIDVPSSSKDRKILAEFIVHTPDKETQTSKFKFTSPFYNLEADASYVSRADKFEIGIEVLGDQVRKYIASLSIDINIRGARLAEYKPTLTIGFPGIDTIRFFGTVVAARGRKQQISFDIKSENFANHPFLLKGNIAHEGTPMDPDSEFQMLSEVTLEALSKTYKLYGTYKRVALQVNVDLGLDYFPVDKSVQSVKLKSSLTDVMIDPFGFKIDSELLMSEYSQFNTKVHWDFSFRLLQRLKSDIIIHYGRDFNDDSHMIHFTHINVFEGDFYTLKHMDFENKIALAIPALHVDSSATFIITYDIIKKPKFLLDVGVKIKPESQIKLEASFESLNAYGQRPIRMNTEVKFISLGYEFSLQDHIEETSPNLLHGRLVIKPRPERQITVDYTYAIRSTDQIFYHELECTIIIPERTVPVQLKLYLKHSRGGYEFGTHLDIGDQSPFVIDVKINRAGKSELTLNIPMLEGKFSLTESGPNTAIAADLKIDAREQRRIVATGNLIRGNPHQLQLEISWDVDKDRNQKLVLTGKSKAESTGRTITASINYADSVNVEISGKLGDPLRYGPHQIKADFTGTMIPMSIVLSYEVSHGELHGAVKYLRENVEKIRADISGKFIIRSNHAEIEGGAVIVSPYKGFDGKEIYAGVLLDSNDAMRTFVTEYRFKRNPKQGYTAKAEYRRKRGFPGYIKSRAEITVHKVPMYEANMNAEYGGAKYYFKASVMPPTNKKFHLDTTMEISARYAIFHHSLVTTFQHLQLLRLNALADLRNIEDYKVQSNFDVNNHKVYDFNATLSSRSVTDFEGKVLFLGKFVPSLHIFTKAQNANSVTKYALVMEKNSHEILSGKGEIRKRKKGMNGNIVFNYEGSDILTIDINSETKSQRERNYVIKLDSRSISYTISIHSQKEKRGNKVSVTGCRGQSNKCITVALTRKSEDDQHDYQLTYRRDDVELNFDHSFYHVRNHIKSSVVIHSGERRYGYDLELDGDKNSVLFGIIVPAREVKFGLGVREVNGLLALEFLVQADARNHPDRKLVGDVKINNQIYTDLPSEIHIKISHPIFEKPIEIHASANYDSSKSKYFVADTSLDFSNNPENKILSHVVLEKVSDSRYKSVLEIYHQDKQHIDFVIKSHSSYQDGILEFGEEMHYKDENNEDKKAYFTITCNSNEEKFNFVYHRSKIDFSIEATGIPAEKLHGDAYEVDFDIIYNQVHTKAKLIHNYQTNCRKFEIFDDDGTVIRTVEMCADLRSPVIFSLKTSSLEEDAMVFDYSLEVFMKSFNAINIRHHWNPEFVGGLIFHLTQLSSELTDAGLGTLPIAESPVYKELSAAFDSKVSQPLKEYLLEEGKKFFHEFIDELKFFKGKVYHYYQKLPTLSTILKFVKSLKPLMDNIVKRLRTAGIKLVDDVKTLVSGLMRRSEEELEKLRAKCNEYPECHHVLEAIENHDLHHLEQAFDAFILRLPPSVQEYVRRGGKIEKYLEQIYDGVHSYLEEHSELVDQILHLLREAEAFMCRLHKEFVINLEKAYEKVIHDIKESESFKRAVEFYKGEGKQILKDLEQLNFESLLKLAKRLFEDYLSSVSLPTLRTFFKINELDSERGVVDLDISFPFHSLTPSLILSYLELIFSKILDIIQVPMQYNSKTLLALFKRAADLNIIPPYKEQAIILGSQHYVTFDKTFYDFAGECTYLLASDFEDGNFSIFITPTFSLADGDSGEREPSIGIIVHETAVSISLKSKKVKHGAELIDLPLLTADLTVTREAYSILIDDHHGLQVVCHLDYDVCTVSISGFYYGKTAGLLGTYDYEPSNDFRRPRGQIPNSVTTFAKSWDLNKGCKTKNLVPEIKINEKDESYKLCEEIFSSHSSLSSCFYEVNPDEYKAICYRYLSEQSDKKKALCSAAAAYVLECEKNYVELELPSSCLTCQPSKDIKVPMKHGERKKFENIKPHSDVIFVIEAATCNDHIVKDLENIARSIEKELTNEGFDDNVYGIVLFDESGHDPYIKTVKGDTFFHINDLAGIASSIHLSPNKKSSSAALEAIRVAAASYSSGIDAVKTVVLMTCTPCKYNFKSLQYPIIQQILLEHDMILHVVSDQELRIKKSASKEKQLIGADADTVYHLKDVTQKDLIGEPALRSQVSLPKDACAALASDVNGSFFSTRSFEGGDVTKSWRSIFARRVVKTVVRPSVCNICDCASTAYHVNKVDCQPCEVRKPRLPFSVCKSCNYPRPLLSLYSYFLHIIL